MDKDTVFEEFSKSLRISINNASVYFHGHPVFLKSIEELNKRILELFGFACPLQIGITPASLFVLDKYWEKARLYRELAQIFHSRKIKAIRIAGGVTNEELSAFIGVVSASARNLIKDGGAKACLEKAGVLNISIDELDYSQLLKGEGEEYKDLWGYILSKAVEKADKEEISAFADNFPALLEKYRLSDFTDKDDLKDNVRNFLLYLKNNVQDKFSKCSRQLVKFIVKNKDTGGSENLDKLKVFFGDFDSGELSGTLWEEIVEDPNFDASAFGIFSNLINKDGHVGMASFLSQRLDKGGPSEISPQIRKKLKDLFSVSLPPFISEIYKKVLTSLSQESAVSYEEFIFDRTGLERNYRLTLLNLLEQEKRSDKLDLVLQKIKEEWGTIPSQVGPRGVMEILEILETKNKGTAGEAFKEIYKNAVSFIESEIARGGDSSLDFDRALWFVSESSLGIDFYLSRIFEGGAVDKKILKMILKIFAQDLSPFLKMIELKIKDLKFAEEFIGAVKDTGLPSGFGVLKHIFAYVNDFLKVEILKAMKGMKSRDDEFLFSLLRGKNFLLKKHAFFVLADNPGCRRRAVEELFNITNRFGLNNRLLADNIDIVTEAGVKEARGKLEDLSRGRSLFSIVIRKKSLRALGKL